MRLLLIASLCLTAAACSKSESSKLGHDVKVVGQDVAVDTKKLASDPAVKETTVELKQVGKKADAALTGVAEKAKASVHEATADKKDDGGNN